MKHVYPESEHQELFYPGTDLHHPFPLHVPSALGALHYFVYLLVPPEWAGRLGGATVHAKLTGLRSTDAIVRAGEGLASATPPLPSKRKGYVWLTLCRIPMARGDGTFTFTGIPEDLTRADVLFCTWPRFVEAGMADDWMACQADPLWTPSGVPLGGIGTGRVDLCRDGRFRNFSGNNNQDMPFEDPDGLAGAYLSVTCDGHERLLATRSMHGIEGCRALQFTPAFPRATLTAPALFHDLDASVTLSGPLVPHDLPNASLPAVLVRWRLTNRGTQPLTARCRFAWPNLVGSGGGLGTPETRTGQGDGLYRYWPAPDSPRAETLAPAAWRILRYSNAPSPVSVAADGHHYLAVDTTAGSSEVQADPRFGSITHEVVIPAGGEIGVRMALVWEMSHWVDSQGVDRGLHWQNRFADGEAILQHVCAHFDALFDDAGALGALVASTDVPGWLGERLVNCCYPLVTNSVLYRDGRFSINEGPTEMSGVYGTIDQRLGAHPATQVLFPELNRRELDEFTATMTPNGEVNHDLGGGHLESPPRGQRWPDIQCSYAIQHARHAWTTGDREFAARAWPNVKKALERHGLWADEGNGVAQLGHRTKLGTSYDSYHYEGTTAYIATLWIAALQVAGKWASAEGDHAFVRRADAWIAAARARLDADLWNGRFYRAYAGKDVATNENSHGGMLAGEYFARMLAGVDILPADRLQACATSWMAMHGHPRFAVPPDEVSPDGSTGALYGWLPYIESFGIAPLAVLRQPGVLNVWQRMIHHMSGAGTRTPCDTRLMYRPVTGEPSWGTYYMTAPASWLVYDALLDFFYAPAEQTLRLLPQLTGSFPVMHPLFWGVGTRNGNRISLRIRRVFAGSPPWVRFLETDVSAGSVIIDGVRSSQRVGAGVYARHEIAPFALAPGASLSWELEG